MATPRLTPRSIPQVAPLFLGLACARSSPVPTQPTASLAQTEVVQHHAAGVYRSWSKVHDAAVHMQQTIESFLANPSEEGLNQARSAWTEARILYGPTEVFRFQGGPIDDEDGPEGLINAWPMDEAYIDYIIDDPSSGIIQRTDTWAELTPSLLMSLNEAGGEENISTGWHAIEFLLWGQDTNPDGPGSRPHTDYQTESGQPHADRRAQYLRLVTALLVQHLDSLVQEWKPGVPDNHRSQYALQPETALQGMLTGMGMLAGDELAGERIAVAWETRDPEDEQSCFSDTTHLDIIGNARGIQSVWHGDLGGQDGPSVRDMVQNANPELAAKMDAAVAQTMTAVESIPVPFDSAIQASDDDPRRAMIETAMEALEHQASVTVEVAQSLGVAINLEGG